MKRVLLTGGSGHLGQELIPQLRAAGYIPRVMSRRAADPEQSTKAEWVQANLEDGASLADAVKGAQIVIHAASNPLRSQVDVAGTGQLLEASRKAGIEQFVYISIVGIDQIDFAYYKNKLAAEQLIEASGLPWTILRATQFHSFVDRILRVLTRLPVAFLPARWQFQTVSEAEVAGQLLTAIQEGFAGRLPDIGGPEILSLDEMARQWLSAQELHKRMVHLPIPGGLSAGFRQGLNTTTQGKACTISWGQWLSSHYAAEQEKGPVTPTEGASEGRISAC